MKKLRYKKIYCMFHGFGNAINKCLPRFWSTLFRIVSLQKQKKHQFSFCQVSLSSLRVRRTKTNMSSLADVNVHICGKEIIKYDLEIKALVQVSP